jgi:hypothetical protein
MNLVRFDKPRARYVVSYDQQRGFHASWCVTITWAWHGNGYASAGEHSDLDCALRHAWRPLIETGWLRHAPKRLVPDSLKPLWQMSQLNHYGSAP